jgi:biopolymer transport protein ExbB
MLEWFIKGGPIMWPILLTSIITVAVVLERLVFTLNERRHRNPQLVLDFFAHVEHGQIDEAELKGAHSRDFVVRTLTQALIERHASYTNALLTASSQELRRFSRGLSVLDTVITLAPLLGLLGTVVGMIHSFGLLGTTELGAPSTITGGIAEALIATASGLAVAIAALIPFNYLNNRLEEARHEIEQAGNRLELLLLKKQSP